MGASLVYLDKPNKDIQFEEGENSFLRYTAASMQGWRINMVSDFDNIPTPVSSKDITTLKQIDP